MSRVGVNTYAYSHAIANKETKSIEIFFLLAILFIGPVESDPRAPSTTTLNTMLTEFVHIFEKEPITPSEGERMGASEGTIEGDGVGSIEGAIDRVRDGD